MKPLAVMSEELAEYLRRNLIHCEAVGIRAGLESAIRRLTSRKHYPLWLVDLLNREHAKAVNVMKEMARHRDEVKP